MPKQFSPRDGFILFGILNIALGALFILGFIGSVIALSLHSQRPRSGEPFFVLLYFLVLVTGVILLRTKNKTALMLSIVSLLPFFVSLFDIKVRLSQTTYTYFEGSSLMTLYGILQIGLLLLILSNRTKSR